MAFNEFNSRLYTLLNMQITWGAVCSLMEVTLLGAVQPGDQMESWLRKYVMTRGVASLLAGDSYLRVPLRVRNRLAMEGFLDVMYATDAAIVAATIGPSMARSAISRSLAPLFERVCALLRRFVATQLAGKAIGRKLLAMSGFALGLWLQYQTMIDIARLRRSLVDLMYQEITGEEPDFGFGRVG